MQQKEEKRDNGDKRKKKETIELMECAHGLFRREHGKEDQLAKAQFESLRKEDQRKDLDSQRKEHQAKLQEHSDLSEKIEQLHNRLMAFPKDGNPNCKQMLSDTLDGCLERATALGNEIGLKKKDGGSN